MIYCPATLVWHQFSFVHPRFSYYPKYTLQIKKGCDVFYQSTRGTCALYLGQQPMYSTDVQFLHQSTGRLPVPGYTNINAYLWPVKKAKHSDNPRGSRIKPTFSYEGIHTWVDIGHAVVYYARATHSFIAGIKYRYCLVVGVNLE